MKDKIYIPIGIVPAFKEYFLLYHFSMSMF